VIVNWLAIEQIVARAHPQHDMHGASCYEATYIAADAVRLQTALFQIMICAMTTAWVRRTEPGEPASPTSLFRSGGFLRGTYSARWYVFAAAAACLLVTACTSEGSRISTPTSSVSLPSSYNFDWAHPVCFRWNRLDDASKSAAARDFLARFSARPTTETSRASVVKIVDDSCTDGTHAPLSPYWRSVQVDIHIKMSGSS
jgi:hypothetical protein